MNEDLINRITYHLSSGGLFNPELADHLAVRNLLMECRDALAQRTWNELTLTELTDAYNQHVKYQPEDMGTSGLVNFAAAIERILKEKNT